MSAKTLRDILLRPRNAGLMVHAGEVIGKAPWKPIIEPEVWEDLVKILRDESRITQQGQAPKYLGSGLYRCGICSPPGTEGVGVTCDVTLGGRSPRYRCKNKAHLTRNQANVDDLVIRVVLAKLKLEEGLLASPTPPEIDRESLKLERDRIKRGMKEAAEDRQMGLMDRAEYMAGREKAQARLAEISALIRPVSTSDPLKKWADAEDVDVMWKEATLEERRMLVARLVTVTIMPVGQSGNRFDPTSIDIR